MINVKNSLAIYLSKRTIRHNFKIKMNLKYINSITSRKTPQDKSYLLYIHVPFCSSFCTFCSFHKFKYEKDLAEKYFKHLRLEIQAIYDEGYKIDCVYVGGGTTLINPNELLKTLALVKSLFCVNDISIESDPNNIAPEVLNDFKGVATRLSVGVQSFNNDILQKMGRLSKYKSADIIYENLQKSTGILPITSLDLIFNIPSQSNEILINDIKRAKSLHPEQITTYPLMISDLTKKSITKSFGGEKNQSEWDKYKIILENMKDYHQINAWSFSSKILSLKDEYSASHGEYIGAGSGAFSFINDTLFVNTYELEKYNNDIAHHGNSLMSKCEFKSEDKLRYSFLNSLFDLQLDLEKFSDFYQIDAKEFFKKELFMLKFANAITQKNNKLELTDFGKYLSLVMMKEFYTNMDKVRALYKNSLKNTF